MNGHAPRILYGFCSQAVMGQVLGIVQCCIATHLIKKAGFPHKTAQSGAVTLIQRIGSALDPNIHIHLLSLDGVYVDRPEPSLPCNTACVSSRTT